MYIAIVKEMNYSGIQYWLYMGFIKMVCLVVMVQRFQQWLSTDENSRIQSLFSPWNLMSPLVFNIRQTPKEVGCNTSEGMILPMRVSASRQGAWASFSRVLYIGWPQKTRPRIKVDFLDSKEPDRRWVYPPPMIQPRKFSHSCTQQLEF